MSKILLYEEATTGVTTNGEQHAFFINENGIPTVKHGSQVITFSTSGSAFTGSSGSSGANGSSGATGTSGVSGTSGQDGAPGDIGPGGTSGSSGISGTNGINGVDGGNGTSGISYGTSGISGTSGSSGTGSPGSSGTSGATGAAGQGVPTGGTAGQVLVKVDGTNYNTQWVNQSGGGGTGMTFNEFWSQMVDDIVPHPGDEFSDIPYTIRITANPSYQTVVQIVDASNTVLKTVYTGTTAPNPPTVPTTGLLAWYKADEGITAAGGLITAWADQGPYNTPLLSPSGKEPNYSSTTLNGILIPDTIAGFSDKYMATSGSIVLPGETGTIFMVAAQYTGDAVYGQFMQGSFTNGFIIARGTGDEILGGFGQDSAPYGSIVAATNNTFYTIRTVSDGTTSTVTLNGTISGTAFTDTSSTTSDSISIFGRASGNHGKKAIAEILIYDYNLSTEDIATVETYLKNKWGHY